MADPEILECLVEERTRALVETTRELKAGMSRREGARAALLQTRKTVGTGGHAMERAIALVRRLLTFTRHESPESGPIDGEAWLDGAGIPIRPT
jgi:hypothetical protein